MVVDIVSHSDSGGGAARAAFRLYKAFNRYGISCQMIVDNKATDDVGVLCDNSFHKKLRFKVVKYLSSCILKLQKNKNIFQSLNLIGTGLYKKVIKSEAKFVNIHWVNYESLTIKEIGKIKRPVIMTLHDMWAFCGTSHLSCDKEGSDFITGYGNVTADSNYESGINLDKYVFKQKKKEWNNKFIIVTPSQWLTSCAKNSDLFKGWNIKTIPNALDTDVFKIIDPQVARDILNLPPNKKLIGFGAIGGISDHNKGFDLLVEALLELSDSEDYHCVVVGQSKPEKVPELGLPIHFLGQFTDDSSLVAFYNSIDVMVVPSRQEAFGQTASEAQACGTPVVCFNSTGLMDAVEHKVTGYLAKPFSSSDLAYGIEWCIGNDSQEVSKCCRKRAVLLWSFPVVVEQYKMLIEEKGNINE